MTQGKRLVSLNNSNNLQKDGISKNNEMLLNLQISFLNIILYYSTQKLKYLVINMTETIKKEWNICTVFLYMEYLFRIIDAARKTKKTRKQKKKRNNNNKKAASTLEINTKNSLKTKKAASIEYF